MDRYHFHAHARQIEPRFHGRIFAAVLTGLIWLLSTGLTGTVAADETADTNVAQSVAQLKTRLLQLQSVIASADLQEGEAQQYADELKAAHDDVDLIEKQRAVIESANDRISGLAAEVEQTKSIDKPDSGVDPTTLSDSDLDARVATQQAERARIQRSLDRHGQGATNPAARREEWQKREADLTKALTDIEKRLNTLPEDRSQAKIQVAATILSISRLRVLTDIEAIDAARSVFDAELELNLPALRLNAAKTLASHLDAELEVLRAEKETRRSAESQKQLADAQAAAADVGQLKNPEVRNIVELRTKYAGTNRTLATQTIPTYTRRLKDRRKLLKNLNGGFARLQEEIQRFGSDASVGRKLLYFKNEFPDPDAINADMQRDVRADAQLYVDQLDYSAALDQVTALEAKELGEADRKYLTEYREVLNTLSRNSLNASQMLSELSGENRKLLHLQAAWEDFSNEHLLWLPSHASIRHVTLAQLSSDGSTVLSETRLAIQAVFSSTSISLWLLMGPFLAACCALLMLQRHSKRTIRELGTAARRGSCGTMTPTLRTMVLTFLVAAEWPLIIMLLGNIFRLVAQAGPALALGRAMIAFGMLMLWMNTVRQCLRTDGLVDSHFSWDEQFCTLVRRWFRSVIVTCGIALLLFFVVHFQKQTSETAALERLSFVAVMLLIAWLLTSLLLPHSKPFVKKLIAASPWLCRTRWLWTVGPVLIPIVLAVLSIVGYHHTALQLNDRLSWSVIASSFVLLSHQLLLRWMKVARTNARLQQAKQRAADRAAAQAAEAAGEGATTTPVAEVPATQVDEEDMELFGLQADSLVRNAAFLTILGCMWGIWADVLPALRMVDQYVLIPAQVVTVEGTDGDAPQTTMISPPLTVGHVLVAGFALVLTIVAVRQLPGLIEVVLQSRGYDKGLRYAVSTISRYTVLSIGAITVAYTIGLRWTQVQWLAAGLSVGLGFGLQEIFANFISGIIILVERPIRIGDVVTLDGVSGVVSRIRIRATSITDWDRREYIVPNREFVTGKLLNWTLSDTTNRIVLNVGIAYGSDTHLAREIMLQVAADHPEILNDPAPLATFEGFGDSALDLILRAYLPNLDNRLSAITELHSEIHLRFADAGIEIPFPQRDLNVYMQNPPPSAPGPNNGEPET